ncbi:dmX-like protein 2 isoform X2 [Ischnura elegans]|uniref:dmX-like protein 2 isoform X2 n=1 Tax=Ischnura elegans TaxID=197161 RepID=UPI001ED86658|nr:dmX-like protein 2 isoform X2 [Ischnura elegans]
MNCHQILSGSGNAGDHCFAVGSVEGIPFTAYAAGCNIVILASTFERVQIIPGACHNYIRISCLDCSTDTGKIAAAYENQVCIFEPTPLINCNSAHLLDYRWVQTGTLQTESLITSLSWNLEGTRLLTGGGMLQLWHQNVPILQSGDDNGVTNGHGGGDAGVEGSQTPVGVKFQLGEDAGGSSGGPRVLHHSDEDDKGWECVWKCHTASPVLYMAFSPDGTLFATAGKSDRLVKIWFENKQLLFPSKSLDHTMSYSQSTMNEFNYGFVYIAHPRAVTQLSWRKTSKFMPKGSVANMLVTSCRDNICRIWVETVLPEDGLINMNQFDPLASQNPKFRTHRHKHRFMQRLKHMKTCFHIRRNVKHHGGLIMAGSSNTIPSLPSTYSVHDFHSYGFHGTGVTPGALHFHLAASINAETDIPLVPSLVTGDPDEEPNLILHWLNNKEMHFSLQADAMLQEMTRKVLEKEDGMDSDVDHHESEHEDHSPRKKHLKTAEQHKVKKSQSQDESGSDEVSGHHQSVQSSSIPSHPSLSAATSINSLAMDPGAAVGQVGDSLDAKIESLLRDWHHGPDLLFSIHPIDGSFLIWLVDWLDEYHPGSFRQAQVSFSTRIPSAFPLGDAMTMSTNVSLYHTCQFLSNLRTSILRQPTVRAPQNNSPDKEESGGGRLSPIPAGSRPSSPTSPHRSPPSPTPNAPGNLAEENGGGDSSEGSSQDIAGNPSLVVSMVTKHNNGTLNLWQLTFNEKSKFSQVLSISHACRASGHRFRVNDITCHPVLPLLLTTSHHNMPDFPTPGSDDHSKLGEEGMTPLIKVKEVTTPTGFCSELILWRVDAVGPLSKSGGVSELARINSPEISAFSNVAWIPTLLPSTTLGNLSNSPSACFVASDGHSLRVYQAVIDARTLLAEISSSERRSRMMDSMVSISTDSSLDEGLKESSLHNKIKIVSQQSTARPGCVIQLDAISDATHDWQNTQFLHVFQEQLITGERETKTGYELPKEGDLGLMETHLGAMVDLQQSAVFEEPFYIVVLERAGKSTVVHMWRLVIASQPDNAELSGSMMYVPDSQLVQDDEDDNRSNVTESVRCGGMPYSGPVENHPKPVDHVQTSHVVISTTKVCTQDLPLPEGVEVVHAAPAAGHLSSASIYPACYAPYIIVTACSDSTVKFWNCKVSKLDAVKRSRTYEWTEWEMTSKNHESAIDIPGQPLNISAAYSGRIACAYKYGKSFTRPSKSDKESRYVNLCVAIYECESTGGSEWVLEDTIHLKNIHLPQINLEKHLDLSYLHDRTFLQKKHKISNLMKTFSQEDIRSPKNGDQVFHENSAGLGLLAVPSFSTLQSLRKSITECGNVCPLTQKHLVQLDWVSNEDGSHILTVGVGSKVMLFTPVSSDLAQANMKAMKESQSTNRPILRKASSLAVANFTDEIRWMKLRKIDLRTADGLPPLPMQISWVRDGILVIGMDSEMHVYSQWKPSNLMEHEHGTRLIHQESEEIQGSRVLKDEHLRTLAQETSQRRLANVSSVTHLSRVASINIILSGDKKKRGNTQGMAPNDNISSVDYMPDYGLFEASRIACPVLPQYHPKQLMELLNSGRIRWVKAILAHLVRCISGTCTIRQGSVFQNNTDEENLVRQRGWSRSRTLSVSYAGAGTSSPMEQRGSTTAIPEELTLDYAEITSIPPLPLWTLLAADKERWGAVGGAGGVAAGGGGVELPKGEYEDLFDGGVMSAGDEPLDMTLDEEEEGESTVGSPRSRRERRPSAISERQVGLSHFGPRQGRMLSRLLTHTHLPGLSSLDQMHLLALADTVSTCNTDFAERFANDAAKTAIAKENLTGVPDGQDASTDSLDDCGLRFLLAMKHYNFLLRCLPLAQRAQFQRQGVGTGNIVWAFHSESEEELLNLIPSYAKGSPRWSTLRELGVGWWLRSNTLLRTCVEKIAKAAFQARQDPLDAALFYLAMKKKSLVWGLFRSRRDERMTSFFSNNFVEDRWRKAALKNAFALLGKQRFEHAAAFFLLAGALKDAIDVCLNKLDDFQLAMVISRLYEGELDSAPPSLQRLLYDEILGCNSNGENQNLSKAHPDPFLRSMALWILKDHTGSLNTLLQTNIGQMHPQYIDDDKPEGSTANPNVFNFYVYLRTHPLLIRQYIASTAQDKKKSHAVVLSGFSYGMDTKTANLDKQILLEDSITPLERQLYFTTAHAHFKAGCPALALEVLSKLPSKVLDSNGNNSPSLLSSPVKSRPQDQQIDTGILDEKSLWTSTDKASDLDWSAPVKPKEEELVLDWSQPVSAQRKDSLELKWDDDDEEEEEKTSDTQNTQSTVKQMSGRREDTEDGEKSEDGSSGPDLDIMAQQLKFVACLKILMEEVSTLATGFEVDGGQLRYQLYVWLEREVEALKHLCNYSAGGPSQSGVNGETTYPNDLEDPLMDPEFREHHNMTPTPMKPGEKPTLHEILLAEKFDFEAKVHRAARRKKWLKANETLLRTLLSYCSLHGASGGGLASVRMELVILLQELQQEKTQQQLLSPLPFPTTLPLLSASVACNKTVIADPVRHLQSKTHDMLQTIVELRSPPMPVRTRFSEVFVLRDLSVALSACIYQSLCDSDSFSIKQQQQDSYQSAGIENIARINTANPNSHLIAGHNRRRRYSSDEPMQVTTIPSKWPGVTNLRALLAREKDEDTPRLNVLLVEAFVATFVSLVVYALSTCDSSILYRLAGQRFTNNTWAALFGGGVKKLLKVAAAGSGSNVVSTAQSGSAPGSIDKDGDNIGMGEGMWNTVTTSLSKQRVRLNMRLLGGQPGSQPGGTPQPLNMKEDRPTYREQFVPPEMSMVSYFLLKPQSPTDEDFIDYDSADSQASDGEDRDGDEEDEEEDVFEGTTSTAAGNMRGRAVAKENTEHSNPSSYSWCVLRLAIVRLIQQQLHEFLAVAGIELQELPVCSPLVHGVLRVVGQWQDMLKEDLESRGAPPQDYIPGCFVESSATSGPAIHKYRSLLDRYNTPFHSRLPAAAPARRLWSFLVRHEEVQDIFIRAVFGKRRSILATINGGSGGLGLGGGLGDLQDSKEQGGSSNAVGSSGGGAGDGTGPSAASLPEPVRIIHKEQDSISAFCLNEVTPGFLALATPREVQEMDISLLLELPNWLEDECEFDILNLSKEADSMPSSSFLVIQTAQDRPLLNQTQSVGSNQPSGSSNYSSGAGGGSNTGGQTGRGATVMKGLNFPGSHNPRFCQFVIDRSRHLLKPVFKHKVDGIRRISAHPLLPLYLTGSQDGSVQMWEWGHAQAVSTPRPAGTYAKVTRARFSQHGNKFGIADGDGNVSLWQVGLASSVARPFFTYQCHSKLTSDFVFLGSCSLLATAGHSSESKNVALWDTLLPQKKALITAFNCHDQGASSVVYAPQHQVLISAGKKGDICVVDLRQRQLKHRFQAHDSPIKCLAIDPSEEFFVTGAADGDIKVWGLSVHHAFYSFPGEHARSSFFKNIGQGVTQLHVDSAARLFSCGADGSMKVRQLPDRDFPSIVQSLY